MCLLENIYLGTHSFDDIHLFQVKSGNILQADLFDKVSYGLQWKIILKNFVISMAINIGLLPTQSGH
jgi:hypothetical protein